jgi:hypothetical protein
MLKQVERPEQTFVYVLGHRYHASQMAFHLPQHPTVYRWCPTTTPESQYEIWPGAQDKVGWDALILDPITEGTATPDRPVPYYVRRNFDSAEKLRTVEVAIGQAGKRVFNVFLARNMKRWPEPEAVQEATDPVLLRRQERNEEAR